jgi:hypothetical protein
MSLGLLEFAIDSANTSHHAKTQLKKKKRGEGLHPLKGVFTTAWIIILCKADI